jgi:hypothetical protein
MRIPYTCAHTSKYILQILNLNSNSQKSKMPYNPRLLGVLWVRDLMSGLRACKAGTVPFENISSPSCSGLFWRWGLVNYLSGLALNLNPPDISLPSN